MQLQNELYGSEHFKGVLLLDIPFPLKFRMETKLIPELQKAVKLIEEKKKELALANGAEEAKESWQFALDDNKNPINKEGFANFGKQVSDFLLSEENAVEIDVTFKLSLFSKLEDSSHFPVLCKFIEDDL